MELAHARIRVVDLETTGFTPPEACVCEIGWADIVATELDMAEQPAVWKMGMGIGSALVNPGIPIPPIASSIHHLIDEDVAHAPRWEEFNREIIAPTAFEITAFAAHSAKMERQWITDELTGGKPWICTYKAALHLWPEAPSHSNQALRYWLRPPGLSRDHAAVSHRAGPDAYVTAHILMAALDLVPLTQLIEWTMQPALLPRVTFGVHRGKPWSSPDVDSGLLHWVLDKDFDEDVKFTVRHELDRREKAAAISSELGDFDDGGEF
jgi:exodeoxyribonuclease X